MGPAAASHRAGGQQGWRSRRGPVPRPGASAQATCSAGAQLVPVVPEATSRGRRAARVREATDGVLQGQGASRAPGAVMGAFPPPHADRSLRRAHVFSGPTHDLSGLSVPPPGLDRTCGSKGTGEPHALPARRPTAPTRAPRSEAQSGRSGPHARPCPGPEAGHGPAGGRRARGEADSRAAGPGYRPTRTSSLLPFPPATMIHQGN